MNPPTLSLPATNPYYLGIDRSDQHFDFALLNAEGHILERGKVPTAPEAMHPWVHALRQRHPLATWHLCIEQPCANLASFFHDFSHFTLYLVNPKLIKRYRESFQAAPSKDDRKDALCIAHYLRDRHATLTPWQPASDDLRRLKALLEARRQLIDQRTELTNRLTAALKTYYPQALTLCGKNLHAPLATAFLKKYPELETVRKARPAVLARFYHQHQCHRPKVIQKRLDLIAGAIPLTTDRTLIEIQIYIIQSHTDQLDLLRRHITKMDQEIDALMSQQPDAALFAALPGAGPNLSARLLVTLGTDRERFATAADLQCFTGIAPITKQSGKTHRVNRRFAKITCPHFEHQTFIEWTGQTITKSPWARAYYRQQRDRGVGHWAAIRSLAYKWQRILFRCWKDRQPYDDATYEQALRAKGSPLAQLLDTPAR